MQHCLICGKDSDGTLNNNNHVCSECLNIQVLCKCGCGALHSKYGKMGRPHDFIHGHNFKDNHHTLQTKEKIRLANTGRHPSLYTIEKLRSANIGKKHPEQSERMSGKNNPNFGKPGTRLGTHPIKETIEKMRTSKIGENNPMFGKKGKSCPNFGRHHTEETKEKMRKSHIEIMKNGIYNLKPTKPEKQINSCLHEAKPNEYKYTGDGSFWIGDLNPDIVNINGLKKCIEHFGCFWHDCPVCFPKNAGKHKQYTAEERIAKYAEYGWDCLVIWEHAVKNGNYKKLIHEFLA